DILVNNAGLFLAGSVVETDEKRWDKVIGTNLKGPYLVSRCAVPALKARGGGSIINTASVHGVVGAKSAAAFCASKGGLVQLTRAMALDHAADHIRVNAICPGETDAPEDLARLALYLASDESSSVTGAVLPVNGGFTAG